MGKIVWMVGGFDPSAGAGILADCRAGFNQNVKIYSVITAVTAQNGSTVKAVEPVKPTLIKAQMLSLCDLGIPSVIKIGLLPDIETMNCVFRMISKLGAQVICDPIISASTGYRFQSIETIQHFVDNWLGSIDYLTPNIPEAEEFLKQPIHDQLEAAKLLCKVGAKNVILKGGHRLGNICQDVWTNGTDHAWFSLPRIDRAKTHGTGCTFSSTLAVILAQGATINDAIKQAKKTTYEYIGFLPCH